MVIEKPESKLEE